MSFELISLENIQDFAQSYGYWAIFLGILLENLGIPFLIDTLTINKPRYTKGKNL
jgi:membrane-associated protein